MPQFPTFGADDHAPHPPVPPWPDHGLHADPLRPGPSPRRNAHLGRGDCRIRSTPPRPSGRYSVLGIRAVRCRPAAPPVHHGPLGRSVAHPHQQRHPPGGALWSQRLPDVGDGPARIRPSAEGRPHRHRPALQCGRGAATQLLHARQPERPGGIRVPRQRAKPRPQPGLHQVRQPERPVVQCHVHRFRPGPLRRHPHLQWRRLPGHHDPDRHPTRQTRGAAWRLA